MAKEALSWYDVGVSAFMGEVKSAWDAYQASAFETNKARESFEGLFAASAKASIPDGKSLVFSYKFNKLSIAFASKAKATGGTFTLPGTEAPAAATEQQSAEQPAPSAPATGKGKK